MTKFAYGCDADCHLGLGTLKLRRGGNAKERSRLLASTVAALLSLLLLASCLGCATGRGAGCVRGGGTELVLTKPELLSPSSLAIPEEERLNMSAAALGRPRVALVLGSGGTRGIAHIGVLKVLRQEHIPIDLVVGCSAGSIIGALFCSGIAQDKLEQIGVTSGRRDVFDYVLSKSGVIDGSGVESCIVEHAGHCRFAELETPLAIICADVEAGEEIVIAQGDVARAVRASCSFPGLIVPMRVNGRLLVDGGVLDKLPVTVARKLGADIVIAVNVTANTQGVQISNAVELVVQTINLMGNKVADSEARLADVLITPDVGQQRMFDFKDASKCIDAGAKAATAALPRIRALLSQEPEKKAPIAK